jgi:hypothetical protein
MLLRIVNKTVVSLRELFFCLDDRGSSIWLLCTTVISIAKRDPHYGSLMRVMLGI